MMRPKHAYEIARQDAGACDEHVYEHNLHCRDVDVSDIGKLPSLHDAEDGIDPMCECSEDADEQV